MAGSYPDVPGYRFAYDIDGTAVFTYNVTVIHATPAQLRTINNDSTENSWGVPGGGANLFCVIFPEFRSLTGIFLNRVVSNPPATAIEYSTDTTNGYDGTWSVELANFTGVSTTINADLRKNITPLSISSCRAIRFAFPGGSTGTGPGSRNMRNIHLYGHTLPTESPDRLRIVDMTSTSTTSDDITPTGEDIAAQLDFGNIPQRNSSTRQFKVVNNSATQTANNITVSLEAPTDASPSLIGQYQVSTDNVAFANAVNIGSLAPGADSGTLYLRNNVASNAQLGVWSARILAQAVSWS